MLAVDPVELLCHTGRCAVTAAAHRHKELNASTRTSAAAGCAARVNMCCFSLHRDKSGLASAGRASVSSTPLLLRHNQPRRVWLPSRTLLLLLHMALLLPRPTAMQRPRLCMRPALHGHTRFEWQLPRLPSKKRLPLLLCMPLLVSRCSCAMTSPALLPRRLTCRRASHLECKKLCLLRLPLLQDCVHTGPSFWVLLECLEHLLSCRALQEGQAKSNAGCVTDSS